MGEGWTGRGRKHGKCGYDKEAIGPDKRPPKQKKRSRFASVWIISREEKKDVSYLLNRSGIQMMANSSGDRRKKCIRKFVTRLFCMCLLFYDENKFPFHFYLVSLHSV